MNTFEKSQAAKMLACYITPEEIQKGDGSEKISMTKKDFKEEHENLIKVLESPSKEDDKEEIKEQEKEAKDYGVELEKADTFKKSQSAKLLACYLSEDLEKGHPAGYINAHGKQKQADGSWKYVGKNKAAKQESKPESNPEQDAIEEHFENKRKNLHETHTKEVNAHYEKMNADSLHHQKLYNDAMKENKPNEELKKLSDAHNESHIKNQEDLKALHSRHDSERAALIKEYSEARKKAKEGSKPMTQGDDSTIKLGQEVTAPDGKKGTITSIDKEARVAKVQFHKTGEIHAVDFNNIHAAREERRKKAALKTTMNKTAARTKPSVFLQNRR